MNSVISVEELGSTSWNVANGDLPLPVITLRESALANNLDVMAAFCRASGVELAPHGKTTMAPQLFERQLAAGAWGITAATPRQVSLMRRFGVPRIFYANQVVDPGFLSWIADEVLNDPPLEFFCLVDDAAVVEAMDSLLGSLPRPTSISVLVEVGVAGGRTGARDDETAVQVARQASNSRHLNLVGVEGYEAVITKGSDPAAIASIDRYLYRLRAVTELIAKEVGFDSEVVILSAGGSYYFDRVGEILASETPDGIGAVQVIVRSGGYLTHDVGKYVDASPLDGRRSAAFAGRLRNALEGWARVLSRPDADTIIVGAGKRDVAYDTGLPKPLQVYRNGVPLGASGLEVTGLMDQHMFVHASEASDVRPGDIMSYGMLHPCAAFDRTNFLPVLDDAEDVIDGVLTFF